MESRRDEVTICANRYATDQQITGQAQEMLAHDPWIDADHVTVTTRNGVVKVEGTVADVLELLRILRLCRKIPGARRVVSEVEINAQLPESG